jgi:hypothetical protein
MKPPNSSILTINGGSSSIKFALYEAVKPLKRGLHGTVVRFASKMPWALTFHFPAPSSNRLWKFGKAENPTFWPHKKPCFIAPTVTAPRVGANIRPRWNRTKNNRDDFSSRAADDSPSCPSPNSECGIKSANWFSNWAAWQLLHMQWTFCSCVFLFVYFVEG